MRVLGVAVVITACGRIGINPIVVDDASHGGSDAGTDGPGTDAAIEPNVAFVTSQTFLPTTFGSDLSGADADCQAAAQAGGLSGTYLAFLSSGTINARDRIAASRGWVRLDGKPFLDSTDDLALGKILYPLTIDELGGNIGSALVFTGTRVDGTTYGSPCDGFTDPTLNMVSGTTNATTTYWTADVMTSCASSERLYCFGVGKSVPVTISPAPGRKAFITVGDFTVDAGGLATADALCASEASLASLSGTFTALMPTTTASAVSRFSLTGPNWIRLDGVPLAASPLVFSSGTLDTPLNVTTAGGYTAGQHVATGGADPNTPSPSAASNCNNWLDGSGTMGVGIVGSVNDFDQGMTACVPSPIYCLEQ